MTDALPLAADFPALPDAAPPPSLARWLTGTALPFWAEAGRDRRYGGFHERVTHDLVPTGEDLKRMRVQARQIYTFSHAVVLGADKALLDAAWAGFALVTEKGWHADGGWVHTLHADGRVRDAKRDAYDHAFFALALGWLYRATGDSVAKEWLDRTLAFVDERLADKATRSMFEDLLPDGSRSLPRRQNPHMHMLEASLGLQALGVEPVAATARAKAMLALFRAHFFDGRDGTLVEFFDDSWAPAAGKAGHIREPGHHFEWVWLLQQAARIDGGQDLVQAAERLYTTGVQLGLELPTQGAWAVLDEVSPDGEALLTTKRLWPMTELAKANLALYERTSGEVYADRARTVWSAMFRHYLRADSPGWIDRIDRQGANVTDAIPASTLYHIFVAAAEHLRLVEAPGVASPLA